ncbi:MAG: formylglycine-generating enzyme family protein [Haliscomenobacteraceae bacterium CHB4]|nr:formylglycine-generating enzyme family protein [Haliscomenobacteraceae bacterium CHB4]
MTEPEPKDIQNKNVVAGSEVNAQGNVHIGDVHHHPTQVVVQSPGDQRNKPGILWLLLLVSLVTGSYFVLNSGSFSFFSGKNNAKEPPSITGHDANQQKPDIEPQKRATSKTHPPAGPDLSTKANSKNNPDPAPETTLPAADPPDKAKEMLAFLKGEVAKIPGKGNTRPFYTNRYEVTVGQYHTFCRETGREFPDQLVNASGLQYPMRHISWEDANAYCAYVKGRLPTAEEWTWAATYGSGPGMLSDTDKQAISWNLENSGDALHPVGKRSPLRQAPLFDMFGNVEEWCADGPKEGLKYTKGGYYRSPSAKLDAIKNDSYSRANQPSPVVGFRVVYDSRD